MASYEDIASYEVNGRIDTRSSTGKKDLCPFLARGRKIFALIFEKGRSKYAFFGKRKKKCTL